MKEFFLYGDRAIKILEINLGIYKDEYETAEEILPKLGSAPKSENKDWITYSLALYTCAKAKEMQNQ